MLKIDESKIIDVCVDGINHDDHPDYCDAFISEAWYEGEKLTDNQIENLSPDFVYEQILEEAYLG